MRFARIRQKLDWLRGGTVGRMYVALATAAMVLLIVPFAFWYYVWYGFSLDPNEIQRALADPVRPSQASQMLLQMGEKMSRGDSRMRRWYPRLIELASHPSAELRLDVAWVMGVDGNAAEFRPALTKLLAAPEVGVRRAAALSLAAHRDPRGRPELLAAIAPFMVRSPAAGPVSFRVQPSDTVSPSTVIAAVGEQHAFAQIRGTVMRHLVKDGDLAVAGQTLVEIAPDPQEAAKAMHALAIVGNSGDETAIEDSIKNLKGTAVDIARHEAESALRSIRLRAQR